MASDPALNLFNGEKSPDELASDEMDGSGGSSSTEKKQRVPRMPPAKVLPPKRPPLAKQFQILRSYAVASEGGRRPVTNSELAQVALVHVNNVSPANPFFNDIGLIRREGGGYVPTEPVIEYHNLLDWDKEAAFRKLTPVFEKTWFGELVLRSLSFGPRPEKDVIRALGEAARATGEWRESLQMLLGYLIVVGLVDVEGGMVRPVSRSPSDAAGDPPGEEEPRAENVPPHPQPAAKAPPLPKRVTEPDDSGANGIRFNVNFNVSMQEMGGWSADRITAFFAGLAQVISAKQGSGTQM